MKLHLAREGLQQATFRLQGTVADKNLSQVGLRASPSLLEVSGADRIVAVHNRLDAVVERPGTTFLPGKLFSDVVKELPEGSVSLELEGQYLVIQAGVGQSFVMKLPIIHDATWNEPNKMAEENCGVISSTSLLYMISQTHFCISPDSPRNYGGVAYLHRPEMNRLRLVGTDGFRLSYCDIEADLPPSFLAKGICISKKGLIELQRMCHECHESISFTVDEEGSTLRAAVKDYELYIRLSAVKYPNYQGVLPSANLNLVRVARPQLQSVARRVLLASDKSRALQLCFSNSSLTLKSRTAGSSESKEVVELSQYQGTPRDLAINGKYLTDVFSAVTSDEMNVHFRGESDPLVVVPCEEPKLCKSMHVLVPIRENS